MSSLSPSTIEIVKATAELVGKHALSITETFYPIMFRNNPEVLEFFNKTNQVKGKQQEALANSVVAFALNIEELSNLNRAVDTIAHKHCGLGILPHHYPIVEKNLLLAIREVLGDQVATAPVLAAWGEAVRFLASVLISREEELYQQAAVRPGGFREWADFEVVEKMPIAERTFYLKFQPVDPARRGQKFEFLPGQYLTLRVSTTSPQNEFDQEEQEKTQEHNSYPLKRNYTVVSCPGEDHLAIAVRHCVGTEFEPPGAMSSYIAEHLREGDHVQLMPPFGTFVPHFYLPQYATSCPFSSSSTQQQQQEEEKQEHHVLLLSAGIGVTPIQNILKAFQKQRDRKSLIVSFHQDCSRRSHAFQNVLAKADHSFYRYSDEDSPHFPQGRVDFANLQHIVDQTGLIPAKTHAYLCGPPSFMSDCQAMLTSLGVSTVHSEVFGPQLASPAASSSAPATSSSSSAPSRCPFHQL